MYAASVPPPSKPGAQPIPPLFSFTGTNVYLLLSPESSQKTPKSVILRGTSEQGPLELEIEVAALPGTGETIHQLAARKSIKELEEGRGWIFHAKDMAHNKLLRHVYEGRFPDMVEREAVRLGVRFQVGGKWCSFVATEDVEHQTEDPRTQINPRIQPGCHNDSFDHAAAPRRFMRARDDPRRCRWYQQRLRQNSHRI